MIKPIYINEEKNINLNITVIGSSNTDMMIKSSELPAPGEIIIGSEFMMNLDGNGANQAAALIVKKVGAQVSIPFRKEVKLKKI